MVQLVTVNLNRADIIILEIKNQHLSRNMANDAAGNLAVHDCDLGCHTTAPKHGHFTLSDIWNISEIRMHQMRMRNAQERCSFLAPSHWLSMCAHKRPGYVSNIFNIFKLIGSH